MITRKLIFLLLLTSPNLVISQLTMDLELLGGMTFNGNKYDYSDDSYSFKLKNGPSFGLGMDIWTPKDYSFSFGYRLSQSNARSTIDYPDGFRLVKESMRSGVLKDYIFYLGVKKKFYLGESFSVIPFVGLYYNLFIFDSMDRKIDHTLEENGATYVEFRNFYTRFNNVGSKFLRSTGYKNWIWIGKRSSKHWQLLN